MWIYECKFISICSQSISITTITTSQSKLYSIQVEKCLNYFSVKRENIKTKRKKNETKQDKVEIFHVFKWIDMCHTHFIIDYGLYGNLKAMPITIRSLLISNKCKELSVFAVRAPSTVSRTKPKVQIFSEELKQ